MSITSPQFDADPDYWEKRVSELETDLHEIRTILNDVKTLVVDVQSDIRLSKTVIDKVAAEVMPTVNALVESPMLKMFMPKKPK